MPELADLQGYAIAFVLVALVVGFGSLIMVSLYPSSFISVAAHSNLTHSKNTTNVTITTNIPIWTNATVTCNNHTGGVSRNACSIGATSGSIRLVYATGTVWVSNDSWNNTHIELNYSYRGNTSMTSILRSGLSSGNNLSIYLPLIAVIISAAVIIGFVVYFRTS